MIRKILLLPVVLFILPSILALGISPAKIEVDFTPNLQWSFNVNVINNEAKYLDAIIYAQGPLSPFVSFPVTSIQMKPDEYSKPVAISLNLPEKIDEPGLHEILITVKEGKKSATGEPISIGSSLSVISLLKVNVPYPGKYATADLFISEAELSKEVTFAVEVTNKGKEDISKAKASITITDPEGDTVATIESDEKPISSMTKRELIAKWVPQTVGSYTVLAVVNYDGKQTSVTKQFNVGNFFLRLLSITVKNFKLGGIAKFDILSQNIGNEVIAQAYSKMLLDEGSKRIMDVDSNRIDLKPQETKEMNSYWDTQGVAKGAYYGIIRLIYSDKSSENKIKMTVNENDIKTELITGMAVASPSSEIKVSSIVYIAIIFFMLAAFSVFFYLGKRKKKLK